MKSQGIYNDYLEKNRGNQVYLLLPEVIGKQKKYELWKISTGLYYTKILIVLYN